MVKKIIIKALDIFSLLIIVFSTLLMLSNIVGLNESFSYKTMRVLSGSMEPAIKTDSLIVVKKTNSENLEKGDIISFISSDPSLQGHINTHRIVEVVKSDNGTKFITKGDNNERNDIYTVKEENVIGKVIYHSYLLGVIFSFISKPQVFFLLITVPLILLIVSSIKSIVNNFKELANE